LISNSDIGVSYMYLKTAVTCRVEDPVELVQTVEDVEPWREI